MITLTARTVADSEVQVLDMNENETARILTPSELAKLDDGDVVWEQLAFPVVPTEAVHPIVKYKGYIANHKYYVVWPNELDAADYGTTWRIWSSKPTDEQIASPWSPEGSFEPPE